MRPNRHGRRTWLLVALALVALVVQWNVLTTLHQRELDRVEADLLARVSATLTAIEVRHTATVVPTATPSPQTPADTISLALDGVLDFMRAPDEAPGSLDEVAGFGFIRVFQRQIDYLEEGGLRLSPRSSYELLSIEKDVDDGNVVEFVTQERWVYDEETIEGEPVRCLVETSMQRYRLERRSAAWTVMDLTLEGTPTREPCAPPSAR